MSQTRQLVTSSGHARLAVFAPERESLPLEEALDLLLRHAPTVTASEEVPLFDADGRICFAHVRADLPQPPYDRVQVDGYALRSADIADATLKAPRDGRVQFRVAQPGEVVAAGGKVLNMVDLSDVFMAFFVPETVAGRIAIGSEARIVLDAAPQFVIPARVSFVSATAQFTPKTVETASERQKLMFRVKAQIDRTLLQKHLQQVKTGLPGVAWLRTDPQREWPAHLAIKVPE